MVPNVDRVNRGHQKAVMDPEKDGNAVLSVSLDWLLRGVVVSQPSKKAKTLQVATNGQRSPIILTYSTSLRDCDLLAYWSPLPMDDRSPGESAIVIFPSFLRCIQ